MKFHFIILSILMSNCNLTFAEDSCPRNGNTKVPETYPVEAYVVSQENSTNDPEFARNLVIQILRSSEFTQPKVILQMNTDEYEKVVQRVRDETKGDERKRAQWIKSLQHSVVPQGYGWQQDYFESFVNPNSGKPEVRIIRDSIIGGNGYKVDRGYVNYQAVAIQKTTKNNGWSLGNDLSISNQPISEQARRAAVEESEREGKSFSELSQEEQKRRIRAQTQIMERHMVNNITGGNIEGLPGGLCLHGNNQPSSYTQMYCGGKQNQVVVDTSWLNVGHADEIIQVVKKPNEKSPCDFAIAYASPKKALELLRENGSGRFFEGFSQRKSLDFTRRFDPHEKESKILNRSHPVYPVCSAVLCMQKVPSPNTPEIKTLAPAASSLPTYWLEVIFERRAEAGIKVTKRNGFEPLPDENVCDEGCKPSEILSITNKEVYEAFQQDHNLKMMNMLIEEKMANNKKSIEAKLKERLPQCSVDFIELPNLFYPKSEFQVEIKNPDCKPDDRNPNCFRMPVKSMLSINPNPANSITVDRTVLVPHPQNSAFAKYIEEAYSKRAGMKTSFVDTYDDFHVASGNLHCATHVINSCVPR